MSHIAIDIGRTETVVLDYTDDLDVSSDTFAAQIRAERDPTSTLLLTAAVDMTNAATGTVVFTFDDSDTTSITATTGMFDIERTSGGEPLSVLDNPISVMFRKVVTT